MNLLLGLLVVVLVLVLLGNWLLAIHARMNGNISKVNGLAQLLDAINVRVYKALGTAKTVATDHVASVEADIEIQKKEVADFEQDIIELRTEVRLAKKNLPKLQAEVAKWEALYLKTVEANDENGQLSASKRLKKADEKLKAVQELIVENEEAITEFDEQKANLKDGLEHAEIIKDNFTAKHKSAILRQKLESRGAKAAKGLTVMKEFEDIVLREQAKAEALEEANNEDNELENQYGLVDDDHAARLAALRAK